MARTGRPVGSKTKTKPWAEALRRALYERPQGKNGPRNLDLLAKAAVRAGMDGKGDLIREIGDRIDGKVPTPLVGEDLGPIAVTVRKFS